MLGVRLVLRVWLLPTGCYLLIVTYWLVLLLVYWLALSVTTGCTCVLAGTTLALVVILTLLLVLVQGVAS